MPKLRPSADLAPVLSPEAMDKLRRSEAGAAEPMQDKIRKFTARFRKDFEGEVIGGGIGLAQRLEEGAEAATERNEGRSRLLETNDNGYM